VAISGPIQPFYAGAMTDNPSQKGAAGPLAGLRVLDFTRILAGPTATQLLGDLGADVIKVERRGEGDDTRKWGPPYLKIKGQDTAAYYLSSNRNKRSLTLDIAQPEAQELARKIAAKSDIFVENFKVGGLAKYGLDYAALKAVKPDIIYCSITGFGQTGPYAPRAGYDYLAQGMGGIMSLTGEPEAAPVKVGIGIADVMCGMYAVSAILAALHHRTKTGLGQYIDLALLDTQVAWLVNEGVNYLTSGQVPKRQGSEHPNIVPYKVMPASDGYFILAVGNDAQFKRFCEMAGCAQLAEDSRFATNRGRVTNRVELYAQLPSYTRLKPAKEWVDGLSALGVPAGPVNDLAQVFEDPQIQEREMQVAVPLADAPDGLLKLIGNPIKMSATPVTYRRPPPAMGEHSVEVLGEVLGLSEAEVKALVAKGVV
jgi:crotonobetainyl-CoA:carnitine CoA-transferase CaiB-like acyl-CoA transferase